MANLILPVILLSIFVLIAFISVDVRFTYHGELIIRIDLLLITVILYPARNKKAKRKKNIGFLERLNNGFIKANATKAALDFLLKKSTLTVNSINIPLETDDPARFAIYSQHGTTLILMLMSYLSLKSEAFSSEDDVFFTSSVNSVSSLPAFDVTLKTSLYVLFSTFTVYKLKSKKRKRRQDNRFVRNKNE